MLLMLQSNTTHLDRVGTTTPQQISARRGGVSEPLHELEDSNEQSYTKFCPIISIIIQENLFPHSDELGSGLTSGDSRICHRLPDKHSPNPLLSIMLAAIAARVQWWKNSLLTCRRCLLMMRGLPSYGLGSGDHGPTRRAEIC